MKGRLIQLSRSPGGLPKMAVASAMIDLDGVADDWQKDRRYHGGRDRALCIFSVELYAWLKQTLEIDLEPGSLGENLTFEGIDLLELRPGDRLTMGACLIELVEVRAPCSKLKRWHARLPKVILGKSGWLARVISGGEVDSGAAVTLLPRMKEQIE